jgi:alpha-L-fucosidase
VAQLVYAGGNTLISAQEYTNLGFGMWFHFNMSTFEDVQWANPANDPDMFNPSSLSFNQWLDLAETAGAKYVSPVMKHHDGFTLWPSTAQPHNISQSAGFSGRDLLSEFYENARGRGLKVIPYLSIWDRRWQADNPGYTNAMYLQHTKDILTEMKQRCPAAQGIWTDGWKWQGDSDYNVVNWASVRAHMLTLWPHGLLIENNHENDLSNTDVSTHETSSEPEVAVGNTLPAEQVDTIFGNQQYFRTVAAALQFTAAQIRAKIALYNSRNASFMLNLGPSTDGLIASDVVTVVEAI